MCALHWMMMMVMLVSSVCKSGTTIMQVKWCSNWIEKHWLFLDNWNCDGLLDLAMWATVSLVFYCTTAFDLELDVGCITWHGVDDIVKWCAVTCKHTLAWPNGYDEHDVCMSAASFGSRLV